MLFDKAFIRSARRWLASLFLLAAVTVTPEGQALCIPHICLGRHVAWIGPEFYHAKRVREHRSRQDGWLYGLRLCLERDELDAFYWGVEGAWDQGVMRGKTIRGAPTKSLMTDEDIEGRFGYTFSGCWGLYYYIRPFIGIGYFHNENRFVHPTLLQVRTTEAYPFGTLGIMTRFWTSECYSIGLNVKVRQMYEGKFRVAKDPDFEPIQTGIADEDQWIVEIPLNWYPYFCERCYQISLTPFYQYRHLGGKEGFPVDFIDTKYWIYGARLTIGVGF